MRYRCIRTTRNDWLRRKFRTTGTRDRFEAVQWSVIFSQGYIYTLHIHVPEVFKSVYFKYK